MAERHPLYEVKEIIDRDLDLVKQSQARSEQLVAEAKATVDEIKREAPLVTDLRKQLEAAQAELTERKKAHEEVQARLAEQAELNKDHEERFKNLDKKAEKESWVPRGVEPHERERLAAINKLGRVCIDAGMLKFAGRQQFNTIEQRAGQSVGTATEGGVMIPTPILQDVQYIRPRYGLARELCTPFTMTQATQTIPINTAEPSVYYVNEKAIPTAESGVAFVSPAPQLSAKTLTAYDVLSLEFMHDVPDAVVNFVGERFLLAVSGEEDRVCLVASNSPTGWFGVLHATAQGVANVTMTATSFSGLVYNDLVDLTQGVDADDAENGIFVFSRFGLGCIQKVKDDQGLPLFHPMAAGAPNTLLGFPWKTNRKMPGSGDSGTGAPFMCFGNFKRIWFGDLEQMDVAWSQDAQFIQGAMVMRLRERYAIRVVLGAGLARLVAA